MRRWVATLPLMTAEMSIGKMTRGNDMTLMTLRAGRTICFVMCVSVVCVCVCVCMYENMRR